MRYVCSAIAVALSILPSSVILAQSSAQTLTITNYRFVSEERVSLTKSNVTYRADLVNRGPALAGLTATLTSAVPSVQVVPGQGSLHFAPLPANSQITSSNTFTILVDRTVPFDFANLQWSFQAPIANAGPNQSAKVGDTVTLNGSGSSNPSGIGTLTYNWTLGSHPAASAATLTNASSVMPTFVIDVPGNYVILLTVSNGAGSDNATVTVSTVNTPPVANAGPDQTVSIGATVVLTGSSSSDVDGNPLTYSWVLMTVPAGSNATLAGASTVSSTFVAEKPGKYVVQLIVNDGIADSAAAKVTITTKNSPPVANAGPGQIVSIGAVLTLDGSGSTDVDGDPLTYKWSLITVPAGSTAALSNPTSAKPTFTADLPDTYVAQLIVNDGTFDSSAATVTIATNPVQPPTANAGANQTVAPNTTVTLSGAGTDPQGLPLSFQWALINKPDGSATALSSTTTQNPTFVADLAGSYVLQLIVNNGFLPSAPSTVTITTSNTPPTANAGPGQNVAVGATVTLNGSGSSDPDHDQLTYSWTFTSRPNGSAATLSGASTVSPTFVADVAGMYVVQLIVNDGLANSNPATVTVTAGGITLTPDPLNLTNLPGTVTVTLSEPAGAGGTILSLASSNKNVATVSATVTIPQGSMSANATVTPVTAGLATILATGPGLASGTTTVIVSALAITVSLDSGTVGVTKTINGTITLNGAAPSGGVIVTLSSNPSGIAGLPATVPIAASGTTGTFTVTGLAEGTTKISATAPGYNSGAINVSVGKLGVITLPSNVTVGPGQSTTFPVNLSTGAPVGGVTITLASSDTSKVTIAPTSVFIAAQATTPAVQPQVTGVNFGSATVSASAPGFTGASQQVQVAGTLSFSPGNLTIAKGATQNLTLKLSGFAPAGGLTINLSSDKTDVATVPATVTFAANAASITVPVTGVAVGSATIHASSLPNLADTTASVTVSLLGSIGLPANVTVKSGQSASFPVTLSVGAPGGGVTVTLSSSDNAKVTVAPASVFIAAGATTPSTQPQVTGVAVGSATITATAAGFTSGSQSVQVTAGAAASIVAHGGTPQSAQTNSAFGAPLVAQVLDATSSPVSGVAVTFTAPPTGASGTFTGGLITLTVNTDANGLATAPTFTANGTIGPYTVGAKAGTIGPANFSLTNTLVPAASISVNAGSGQSAKTNTAFATALQAKVLDAGSKPVSGVAVTFTAPATGTTGTFTGGLTTVTVNTDANGLATAPTFTANGKVGAYTVAAKTDTVGPANFTLTNTPGPPALITPASGTPQSAQLNTAFATPLVAMVTDASGNPVSGVIVTFTAPGNGASGAFAGGVNTALTNTSGVATSAMFTANGTAGTYTVTASVSGLSASAIFSMTNTSLTSGGISLTNASVGQNLETAISLMLPQVAPPGGVRVTLSSSDPSKLVLAGRPGDVGTGSLTVGVPEGLSVIGGIFVQALAGSGTVTITATAQGFSNGTGTMTLMPSGFVLAGPGGIGAPFSSAQGVTTTLTVSAVRLDSSRNLAENQQVRAGFSASVTVTLSDATIGTITTSPLSFTAGVTSLTTQFIASSVNVGSTTATADVPPGFTAPAPGLNALTATVTQAGLAPANVTVGQNLEVTANVLLNGVAPPGGLQLTLTSNNPSQVLLSKTATDAGSPTITLTLPGGVAHSPDFFIYGVGKTGTATYTATAPGFGSSNGTATLAPSGFVISGPFGLGQPSFLTTTGGVNSDITVYSALLDSNLNYVSPMPLAGQLSVKVNVTSTDVPSAVGVGSITTSPVTINGGSGTAATQFHPMSGGNATVAVNVPAGFSMPAQNTTVTAMVNIPGIAVTDGVTIGNNLQVAGTIILGQPAPAGGLAVKLTSSSNQLSLAPSTTGLGSPSITINIPGGSTIGSYFLQGFGSSGTVTYTATAPGFASRTGTMILAHSGAVIAGPFGLGTPFFLASVSSGNTVPVTISMAQLDNNNNVVAAQTLAGGVSVTVNLNNTDPTIGTIGSSVFLTGGSAGVDAHFTPLKVGQTTISVVAPTGYSTATNDTSLTAQVKP